MSLYRYILKRILAAILTILGVITITFFFSRMIPGNPVFARLPFGRVSLEDIQKEERRLGLDKPVFVQFIVYVKDMLTGNWSFSFTVETNTPVWDLILARLPRTLEVMFYSMIIAIFIGSRLGRITGAHRNDATDTLTRSVTYFLISIPAFVIVLFLVQIYVYTPFKFFPMHGYKDTIYTEPPTITHIRLLDCILSGKIYLATDYLRHLAVPLSAMTLVQLVVITRQTRSNMFEVLEQNYINTARVKGCSEKTVMKKHAFKNAVTPTIMVSSMGFPVVLGGMIAVEKIYNWVGMGVLFYDATTGTDYPLVIACIYVFALVVIITNLFADIIVAMIDPRIRLK